MQINVTDKKEQPLLSRTMLKATLEFEKATPSYPEVTSLISSNIKADEKLIAIQHIYTSFGDKKADNLLSAIEKSKSQPLSRLLFGLGIANVGQKAADIIAQRYPSIEVLGQVSSVQLEEFISSAATGLGPNKYESLHQSILGLPARLAF